MQEDEVWGVQAPDINGARLHARQEVRSSVENVCVNSVHCSLELSRLGAARAHDDDVRSVLLYEVADPMGVPLLARVDENIVALLRKKGRVWGSAKRGFRGLGIIRVWGLLGFMEVTTRGTNRHAFNMFAIERFPPTQKVNKVAYQNSRSSSRSSSSSRHRV